MIEFNKRENQIAKEITDFLQDDPNVIKATQYLKLLDNEDERLLVLVSAKKATTIWNYTIDRSVICCLLMKHLIEGHNLGFLSDAGFDEDVETLAEEAEEMMLSFAKEKEDDLSAYSQNAKDMWQLYSICYIKRENIFHNSSVEPDWYSIDILNEFMHSMGNNPNTMMRDLIEDAENDIIDMHRMPKKEYEYPLVS